MLDSKKFDFTIMNPPYEGSLHLQILKKIIPFSKKIINISPLRWLQDPLANHKKDSDFIKYENSISKKIEEIQCIKSNEVNKIFNISCGDLGIYIIGNGGFNYSFSQDNPLIDKFISKTTLSFMDVSTKEGYRGKYTSQFFGIINSHYGDTNVWIKNDYNLFTTKRETNTNKVIFFKRENEMKNCFNFLCLKSMLFYARIIRVNQRIPWQFVPYLDFTEPWTDKRFCEYFGITGYISDTEAEQGSEWETILNVMKEFEH